MELYSRLCCCNSRNGYDIDFMLLGCFYRLSF